ncbi:MAG: hypothetical protein Q4B15_07920 [Lachnospiraceae bacterium]|nr:hypothetical protein [Lachnospiraceae bacterium]
MKAFKNYENTQAISDAKKLPKGGYVCKILNAAEETMQSGQSRLRVSFDIEEGEYKGFYSEKYRANQSEDKKWGGNYFLYLPIDDGSEKDEWTKRKFKTFTNAVEDSNAGYRWDWNEAGLKGKTVGIVFNEREYEFNGKRGMTANAAAAYSVDAIRNNAFKIPADRFLSTPAAPVVTQTDANGFMTAGEEAELPW